MNASPTTTDGRLLAALDELDAALEENIARSIEMRRRIREQRRLVADGSPLGPIVEAEDQPRTVELLTENIETLHGVGSRLRSAQALALRDEGLTISEIAGLFGVTRQRVSALLRPKSASDAGRDVDIGAVATTVAATTTSTRVAVDTGGS